MGTFVLVDTTDDIVDKVELGPHAGLTEAKRYFMKRKMFDLDESSFDKIWRVMYETTWKRNYELGHRKPSSYMGEEWWKDDDYLDIDK